MSTPRIEVDLSKVRHNTQTVVKRLEKRGINVTGVTKASCGNPNVAEAMLCGGALGLADARLSNVQRLRTAGLTCPITLIRTPMLSQAEQVVQICDTSYNTEIVVIAALAAAAIRKNTVHDIILMVEMGDLREGILPENLATIAQYVMRLPGVALKGIGSNFACLSGIPPNASKMAALCDLATETEGVCGTFLKTVSGGGSASLPWALGRQSKGRINDLRLGEAILLGVDPVTGDQIGGLYTDAFTLVAEVIETDTEPVFPPANFGDPALVRLHLVPNSGHTTRLLLAIGYQDTDVSGLSMPSGHTFVDATSDHLVICTNRSPLPVGAELRFQMNYKALMQAMAAPDIDTRLLHDRSSMRSRDIQGTSKDLASV
ncbi:alanine/ornithine racemase family PLP-dependent enzyme [Roseobacter weihaiensis]|uniref:alanine/ornithine racemase family PLP-dependent enzyme n=1 Tax=Roseobacter weihaiensis TaxID=2763262 RepID=UPI001D0AEF52|nr:alanine/ornithine racemase family PLP-dependent enzyme [Roseobacter sp. H9]